MVHPANIQDRDGAYEVLRQARRLFPFIERIFADGGYRGEKMALVVARTGSWKLEIVKRSDVANGFEVLPKRWIVERTFAWLGRCRRLAKDFENLARIARTGSWRIEVVKRPDIPRFEVLPKRWIVERTFAWLGRCRRLAKDFENLARTALAFIWLASIRLLLRRLTRAYP